MSYPADYVPVGTQLTVRGTWPGTYPALPDNQAIVTFVAGCTLVQSPQPDAPLSTVNVDAIIAAIQAAIVAEASPATVTFDAPLAYTYTAVETY